MIKIIGVVKHQNAAHPHFEVITLNKGIVQRITRPYHGGGIKVDQVVKVASDFTKVKRSDILVPSHIADTINEKEKDQNG